MSQQEKLDEANLKLSESSLIDEDGGRKMSGKQRKSKGYFERLQKALRKACKRKGIGWDGLFGQIDRSGDGELKFDEFIMGIYRVSRLSDSKWTGVPHAEMCNMFSLIDADGSARISNDEFLFWILMSPHEHNLFRIATTFHNLMGATEDIKRAFDTVDRDGNGHLDVREFTRAVRQGANIGPKDMTNEQVKRLFEACAGDDRVVDLQEFIRFINEHSRRPTVEEAHERQVAVLERANSTIEELDLEGDEDEGTPEDAEDEGTPEDAEA